MSEFFGSGRQSRIALKAIGKICQRDPDRLLRGGLVELGHHLEQQPVQQLHHAPAPNLWAMPRLASGWDFSGGTGWSLVTETTSGLTRGTEVLPSTIDAQYSAGFVWARQYSFRVSKNIGKKFFLGASVENAEMLNPAGQNLPTNYLFGSTGTGGGLYNSTANYSFNYTPDFVVKVAIEPGWGHWEAVRHRAQLP